MSITELSIKRPAAVVMVVILILSLGAIGYLNLGADLLPSNNIPIITIVTAYQGAGVEEVEKQVIKPIEDAVCGLSGIDSIRSISGVGYGYSIITFSMETNMEQAFMDIQQALGDISDKLPDEASKPILKKVDNNSEAIMMLTVSGDAPYEELYYQSDNLKKELEKLKGVGNVSMQGALQKELSVNVDKAALDYYGLNINAIVNRLLSENLNGPAGKIEQGVKIQTLRVIGEFDSISEIESLRIFTPRGGIIRLADVADIEFAPPDQDRIIRLNQQQSIGLFIQKQSDANIVETIDRIKKELDSFKQGLPEGIEITVATDGGSFINSTLSEVKKNLIEGIITTCIVMLLFLRSWRSSLIVLVSIPTSLIATFFMMYVLGFTLNIMSLVALSLCIGILVDDSIVVLENIQRHLKMGKNPMKAALEGRKEIGMAAIAITLCDVVVFGPVAFMSGMIGQFFKEFGLTVVSATLFSLVVSFTLTPVLASRLLKSNQPGGSEETLNAKKKGVFSKFVERLSEYYGGLLSWSLNNRWKVICVVAAGIAASCMLIPLKFISTEFLPATDQGALTLNVSLTPGTSLEQTDDKIKLVENYLKELPGVKNFLSTVGQEDDSSTGKIAVNLVDKNSRKKSQSQMAKEIRAWGKAIPGIDFSVIEASIVGVTSIDGAKPVVLNITGSDSEVLRQLSGDIEKAVRSIPGITDVSNSSKSSISEFYVDVDHLAASEYGITAADIAGTLRTAVNGTQAGVFRKDGDQYDIMVKFKEGQIVTSDEIGSVKIVGASGREIYLDQVASIGITDAPQELMRQDRRNMVSVSANIEGRALGSVNKDIQNELKEIDLPRGYEIKFGGDQSNMADSFDSLIKALIASVLLVYMILVVLYESFMTPLIRMLSLPCGIIGALASLALTGNSLNTVTLIGLIMLDGLASKNGTLLIDYTNTLMKKGMPLKAALLQSGKTRLKPILMTSITMIVGMLPAALAIGEGSEIKSGMAIALIGGMITSTLLSPILLPVVYTMMDDAKAIFSRKSGPEKITLEVQ
ncbi:HAE1 family hydrophobic/amphiphilic exporter-1 [Anaerobacterium chartisolvens]|uniref:HAE1 family hydrophobic/amphiphilic exporter-1 n=1 Tax=Anaerobacterium chartisolvens TaxID=1297424 RepID=A0A369AIW1_9FIRM|nr:efflux RND transporter permease subunit [Anaerobacterium chartisolvens]RCX08087.1 HAE1 family hydrophobic/amphiphilic exporter-1 [Anaerobacterium chartisolvens]